jgi:hypothetical protein
VARIAPERGVPVVVILGSADTLTEAQEVLIEKALRVMIAPSASERSAIVIDGGTDSGVMRLVGLTFNEAGSNCRLVGVVPEAKLIVDAQGEHQDDDRARPAPCHDDIILTGGDEWGSELTALIGIVERLTADAPVLVIVAGGGDHTRREFEVAQDRGWPTLVLTRTGGTADRLLIESQKGWKNFRSNFTSRFSHSQEAGPIAACSAESGLEVMFVDVLDTPSIGRVLTWRLRSRDHVLKLAWQRVADFELEAERNQPHSKRIVALALALGVLTTLAGLLVVLQPTGELPIIGLASNAAYVALVALPLLTTSMVVVTSRRRKHDRWILVRTAAESLKRELYLFRCRPSHTDDQQRRDLLAKNLEAIDNRLLLDVPLTVARASHDIWPPYALWKALDPQDRLLDRLRADTYVKIRVRHQLTYYDRKIARDDSTSGTRQWGTVALAFGATVIAVTVGEAPEGAVLAATLAAASTAIAAGLAYNQEEQRVAKMADAAVGLRSIEARHAASQDGATECDAHVIATEAEKVLARENEEWSRSLRQAFAMVHTTSGQ